MALALDILSWILLAIGGFFVLVGGIGALRMPTFYSRLHASSLTDSAGTIAVLLGLMLQAGLTLATIKLLSALVLLVVTGPTATYALANAALLAGLPTRATQIDADPPPGGPDTGPPPPDPDPSTAPSTAPPTAPPTGGSPDTGPSSAQNGN